MELFVGPWPIRRILLLSQHRAWKKIRLPSRM